MKNFERAISVNVKHGLTKICRAVGNFVHNDKQPKGELEMNDEQRAMLLNVMIITDEYNLLQEKDQSKKDYEEDKKDAYHSLMRFIVTKGDK